MPTETIATGSRFSFVAIFLTLILLLSPLALKSEATPVKIADAQCARCHKEIFDKYLKTPMANASGEALGKLIPGSFIHAATGKEYMISLAGTSATLSIKNQRREAATNSLPLNYFLGSGHLGITYLYSIDKFLFESPIAWYSDLKAYDMKPGLAELKSSPPAIPMQSSCLRCHMSAVQSSVSGTVNQYDGLPFLHTGITCETCHGDGQKHVASKGKAVIVNPIKLNADQRDSVCISCHLEGDVTVERASRNALDYQPGESISKYLAFYVYGGADPTSRGVSEVEQFAKSTCKRMSGDRMACTSCHDPHYTPAASEKVAFYRSKCLACHSDAQFAASHHAENRDCTSCHMTRTGAQNIPHVAWTDHRILRTPLTSERGTAKDLKKELSPIFSPTATPRDLAMAYYLAMLEGDESAPSHAWSLLRGQQTQIDSDPAALDALGVLLAEGGDSGGAETLFRKVLMTRPEDMTALSNLAIVVARKGDLKGASNLLQNAFNRNEDVSGLALNLARIQCAAGDAPSASATLNATLKYNPDLESVERLIHELSNCSQADHK
jgi:Flp pilus assembly protein TadD